MKVYLLWVGLFIGGRAANLIDGDGPYVDSFEPEVSVKTELVATHLFVRA